MGRIRRKFTLYPREYPTSQGTKVVWWYSTWDGDKRIRASTGIEGIRKRHLAESYVMVLLTSGSVVKSTPLPLPAPSPALPTLRDYSRGFWDWNGPRMAAVRLRRKITQGTCKENQAKMDDHILKHLGDYPLEKISPRVLEGWMLALTTKSGLSPKTANNILSVLRSVLQEAVRLGDLPADPSANIKPYRKDGDGRDTLTPEEGLILLAREEWWENRRRWAMNLVAATTGARAGELIALTVGKVHGDRIEISATLRKVEGVVQGETKTGKKGIRLIPLAPKVAQVLGELCTGRGPGDYVFSDDPGKPLYINAPVRALQKALENAAAVDKIKLGSRKVDFHSWRHWFNSMVAGRASGEALRSATGHRTQAMTDNYFHQMDHHLEEVAQAQVEAFGKI